MYDTFDFIFDIPQLQYFLPFYYHCYIFKAIKDLNNTSYFLLTETKKVLSFFKNEEASMDIENIVRGIQEPRLVLSS